MSKLAPSYLVGGNVNLYNFFGGAIWKYLSKCLTHILFGLAIPDVEIDPTVMLTFITNAVCSRIFTGNNKMSG